MKVDLFDFELPGDLIADHPFEPRDMAKMLHIGNGLLDDRIVHELPELLKPGDVIIGNDTRVIPARLFGKRDLARVEITLHKRVTPNQWLAFAKPAKRLKEGQSLVFGSDFSACVEEKHDMGEILVTFDRSGTDLTRALERYGKMPLPPYIKRSGGATERDRSDYQTVFAKKEGAVAAPTAGLHFTPSLLESLSSAGISFLTITLHVGAGTFLPVKVEDTDDHIMHSEWGEITKETVERIDDAKKNGGRVIAVGTTVLRLLETASDDSGNIHPFSGETDLFITPGYRFKTADYLLTNFHLPKSTLFMLVCAFAGMDRMKEAYTHAREKKYRFYSYGDCCLLKRTEVF